MTSICVFGAVAIGGFMAAKLEMAGTPVTVVARGPHGEALRTKGLTLVSEGQESVTRPRVATDPKEIGLQDYLVLTLKAHSLLPAMAQLEPLIGPNTTIVAAINGVPWWYTYKLGGEFDGRRIESVDPEGKLTAGLPPAQVLGSILRPAGRHRGPLHGGQRQVGLRVGRVSGRSGLIVLKNLRDKGRRVAGGGQRFVFRSCIRLFFSAFRHIYLWNLDFISESS